MNDRWERGKPVPGGGCGEQSRVLDYTVTVAGLQYSSITSLFYFSPQFFFPFPLGGLGCYSSFFSSSLFSPFRSPQKPPHFLTSTVATGYSEPRYSEFLAIMNSESRKSWITADFICYSEKKSYSVVNEE